jgi:peptidoglycan/xylan/chitin deacetylase (PgdA/CDA1 family)
LVILLKKRTLHLMWASVLFIGISIGVLNFGLHPNMHIWKKEKIVITDVATDKKIVALTFDDGPDPTFTPIVLDVLEKYDAKATFFVLGVRAEKNPDIIKRMAREGHEVGNHSYSHRNFSKRNSKDDMLMEIKQANDIIYRLSGQKSILFRPPGGYLSDALIDIIRKEKITIAYWSYIQDSKDWKGYKAERIAAHLVKNIKPGQIIILHDGCSNGMQTAKAVNIALDRLTREGWRFVTVSELIDQENK